VRSDPTSPLEHAPDDVRQRAADLLSRPPFTDEEPGPVARLLEWLGDLLAGVFGRLTATVSAGGLLGWAIVLLGTAVLVVVVLRGSRGLRTDRARVVASPVVAGRSADDWHADADRAEQAGDLRTAVRCRYSALVAHLVDGGILDDRPGRTVRELDAEVAAGAPDLAPPVHAASRRFEAIRYGAAAPTSDDHDVVTTAARTAARHLAGRRVGAR
jgi:hypothetical protein